MGTPARSSRDELQHESDIAGGQQVRLREHPPSRTSTSASRHLRAPAQFSRADAPRRLPGVMRWRFSYASAGGATRITSSSVVSRRDLERAGDAQGRMPSL